MLLRDGSGRVTYFILLSLGMAALLAYNSLISSPPYVEQFYRFAANDPNATAAYPSAWANMPTLVAVTSLVPNFALQCVVVSPLGQSFPMHGRIVVSMVVLLCAVATVALLPLARPSELTALVTLLLCSTFAGGSSAVFQGSLFGLASMLDSSFVQAALVGLSFSGSLTSLLRIVIKAAVGEPTFEGRRQQANLFFGLAAGWLMVCLGMVVGMPRIGYLKKRVPEYGGSLSYIADNGEHEDPREALATSEQPSPATTHRKTSPAEPSPSNSSALPKVIDDFVAARKASGAPPRHHHSCLFEDPLAAPADPSVAHVVRCIWPVMLANALAYVFTFLVFPQLCSRAGTGEYFAVVVIFLFNLGDSLSRVLCRYATFLLPTRALLPMACSRIVFLPIVVLCVNPAVIPGGNAVPYVVLLLVGLTNGHTSANAMMQGPSSLALPEDERSIAGSAMSLSLSGGASLGSVLALAVNHLV